MPIKCSFRQTSLKVSPCLIILRGSQGSRQYFREHKDCWNTSVILVCWGQAVTLLSTHLFLLETYQNRAITLRRERPGVGYRITDELAAQGDHDGCKTHHTGKQRAVSPALFLRMFFGLQIFLTFIIKVAFPQRLCQGFLTTTGILMTNGRKMKQESQERGRLFF